MKSCSMKTIKYILFIVNLFFCLSALLLIIAGILLQTKGVTSFSEDMKMAQSFVILILCIGCLVFILAFFGVCGAINESPWKLNTYGGLIITMIIVQVALIVVAVVYRNDALHFLKRNMKRTLQNETDAMKLVWDKIQSTWECCAIDGPGDYSMPDSGVPSSCCAPGVTNCEESKAFSKGCYDSLKAYIMTHFYTIIAIDVIITVAKIIAAVMAFMMASAIKNETKSPIPAVVAE